MRVRLNILGDKLVSRLKLMLAAGLACALAACSSAPELLPPSEQPLTAETVSLLGKKGMQPGAPIFVRIFKEESELEVWKMRDDGRFYHFKTYPICNWSGELGPKLRAIPGVNAFPVMPAAFGQSPRSRPLSFVVSTSES